MQIAAKPENWLSLFNWSGLVLQRPKRGGKRHNINNSIKKRISEIQPTASPSPKSVGSTGHQVASPTTTLAQAVTSKLEGGSLRAAIRLLCSEDTPAPRSLENLTKLQQKHPQASLKDGSLPDPKQYNPLSIDEADVRKAVLSFPTGSSVGHDGLRPQHLKDLMQCRESRSDYLAALTAFVNLVLAGHCPDDIAPTFFGGRLIALNKKSGGIRPIAVGFTLRRLTSKCANAHVSSRLETFFRSIQLGVGTPGGCEAAVHSARRFLKQCQQTIISQA